MSSKYSGFRLSVVAIVPIVTLGHSLVVSSTPFPAHLTSKDHSTKSYGSTTVTLLFLEWVSRQGFHLLGPKTTHHLQL